MSDELTEAPNAGEQGGGGDKKPRPHLEIQKNVATRLANSGPELLRAVQNALVDIQQERRKTAILKAIEKITAEDRELGKLMQQGTQSFGPGGEKIGEPVFTKQQVQDIRQKREAIQKLDAALTTALDKLDFQRLFELTGENK